MPRGGRRPGAGNKKGSKRKTTIAKLTALEVFRQRVEAELDPLITAQLSAAKGLFHFFADTDDGPVRVTDPEIMRRYLQQGMGYHIAAKDPDVRALKDSFDRVFGTPVQQVNQTVVQSGTVQVIHRHLPATV